MNSRRKVLILIFILFFTEIKNEKEYFEEDKILKRTSDRLPSTGSDHKFTSKGPGEIYAEVDAEAKVDTDLDAEIEADKINSKLKENETELKNPKENVNLPILFEPAVLENGLKVMAAKAEVVTSLLPVEGDNKFESDSESDSENDSEDDDSLNDDLEQLRSILRLLQQILLFIAALTFSFIIFYTAFYINVLRKIYIKPSSKSSLCIKR